MDSQTIENKPQLPSVSRLSSDTYSFYKLNFSRFAWFIVLIELLQLFSHLLYQYLLTYSGAAMNASSVLVVILSGLVFIAILVTTIILGIAFVKSIIEAEKGNYLGFKETWHGSTPLFWSLIFLGILTTLIYLGSVSLFVIPVFIILTYIGFSSFILIDQHKKGFHALGASWNYVRNYWWVVFGRYAFMGLMVAIASFVFLAISAVIFKLSGFHLAQAMTSGPQGLLLYHPVAYTIYTTAALLFKGLIIAPFVVIFQTKIYRSLVAIKAGTPTDPARSGAHEEDAKMWCIIFLVLGAIVIFFGFTTLMLRSSYAERNVQANTTQGSTTSTTATLYVPPNGSFQMLMAPGWAGAPSVAQPDATIFSNPNQDIAKGVVVVAPIAYAAGEQDAATDSKSQQAIAADVKTQLNTEGVTITGSNLSTMPFSYQYTKPVSAEQNVSVSADAFIFFGPSNYDIVAAESSTDNWAAQKALLTSMIATFKILK